MKYNGGRRPCAPTGLAIKTVPHNIRKCCNEPRRYEGHEGRRKKEEVKIQGF
jgi:hypothetical protein